MFPCICIIQCYNFCFIVKHDLANPRGERKPIVFLSYYCLLCIGFFSPDIPRFLPYSFFSIWRTSLDFPGSSDGKESACNTGELGLIPGSEDPLEKEMVTHSYSCLAEECGGLQSMGLQRVRHD